jgi:uncharacterized protein YjbI with pentapeptide repeats
MTNEDHLLIVLQGLTAWNHWRRENPKEQIELSGANLKSKDLTGIDFNGADLSHAILNGANFSWAKLNKADLSSAKLRNSNLSKANLSGADCSGTDLREVNLSGSDLSRADLTRAKLQEANLDGSDLNDADLSRADIRWAILCGANLCGADLVGADLRGTNLQGAHLIESDLSEARLGGAILRSANLDGANLRKAKLKYADLSKANLSRVNLSKASLVGANLFGANLINAILVQTDLERADITNCKVYGVSAWDLKLKDTKQINLIITPPEKPTIAVDDLEVARFLYLLINHKKLRNVLNSITKKGVLILGRFGGGGLDILESIAAKLREMKYLPIIFNFDRPEGKNYTETVKTLVGLSRFVIVDLSGPSVPQELYSTVPHFKIPFIPIIEDGKKQYSMFADILEFPWVLKPVVKFAGKEQLIGLMKSRIIDPAEEKCKERQKTFDQLFDYGSLKTV